VHIDAIESFYRWDGRLQHAREFRLILKSTAARARELQRALRALHPYQLPAIYVLTPSRVDPAYARWVQQCTTPRVTPQRKKSGTRARR
jgi:periplasmic divalent cation tolerance protein